MAKELRYELSIETAEALAGLRDLTSSVNKFDSETRKITPAYLKAYEKEITKSSQSINTMRLTLDKLNKQYDSVNLKIADVNKAMATDSFTNSTKKIEAYRESIKKLNSEIKSNSNTQKNLSAGLSSDSPDVAGYEASIQKGKELKKSLDEIKSALREEEQSIKPLQKEKQTLAASSERLAKSIAQTSASLSEEKKFVQDASDELEKLAKNSNAAALSNGKLDNSIEKVNKDLTKKETLLSRVKKKMDDVTHSGNKMGQSSSFSASAIGKLGAALAGLSVAAKLKDFASESIDAFKTAESAYKNFEMTVKGTGNSVASAMSIVKEITASGLVTTEEAMETLNNYLKMGFTMNQTRGQMKRDLDLGAARKQSHYSTVGEAMKVASQGNLQENSALSDALGNPKNISVVFSEYSKGVDKTTDSLNQKEKVLARIKASEEANKQTAGAAAKLAGTVAAQEARLNAEYTKTKEIVGQALAPAYSLLLEAGKKVLEGVSGLVIGLKSLGLTAADFFSKIGALWDYAFDWDRAKLDQKFEGFKQAYEDGIQDIVNQSKGAFFAGQDDETEGKKNAEAEKSEAELANIKRKAEELNLKKEKLALEKSKIELDLALQQKLITLEEYKKKASDILSKAYDVDVKINVNEVGKVKYNLANTPDITSEAKQEAELKIVELDKALAELKLKETEEKSKLKDFKGFNNSSSSQQDVLDARMNLVTQNLSNELSLFKEISSQELSVLQDKFSNFEITTEEYYKRKRDLLNEDFKHQEELAKAEVNKAKSSAASNEAERVNKVAAIASAENNLKIIQIQRTNALKDLTREQQRYQEELDKQTKSINIDRSVNVDNTRVQLAQVEADLLLATDAINQTERLKMEADFQNKLLDIQKNALEERKKLAKNPMEVAQLNAEIESLELQHSVKLKQISNDIYTEQRRSYDELMSTTRSSLDSLFDDMSNIKSVLSNLAKQIAIIFAKKALGYDEMFKEGGSLSNFVKKLLGTPEGPTTLSDTSATANSSLSAGLLGSVLPGAGAGAGTTGSMSVQAGVVNLSSGGIGGDLFNTDKLTEGLGEKFTGVFDNLGSSISGLFSSLSSTLSSVFSSLGGGGGSSIVSGIGGFLSSLASFDTGADNLSRDQIAMVHKGERILTARENKTASALLDNPDAVISKAMRNSSGQSITNNYNFSNPVDRRTSDQLASKSADAIMRAQRNR